jgi:hypothetical protein
MKKLPIRDGEFWIDHFYGGSSHPYFGVYEGNNLVCVCVYRKGAEEVLRRLAKAQIPEEGGESNDKERCYQWGRMADRQRIHDGSGD